MLHKEQYEKALGRTINDDYDFANDIYDEDKVSALRKINKGKMNKMYVINYCDGIYAGTYDNANGTYLYSSNSSNKKEPKIFRTLKGVTNHISNLKKKIPGNVGIVKYLMPYSTYEHEFLFQADLDTNIVVKAFCNAVEEEVQSMIRTIKECSKDLKNLF